MTQAARTRSETVDADNCGGDYRKNALSVQDAQSAILDECIPVVGEERLALRSALERVLAEDVETPIDVPAHTNSAMDGYAFQYASSYENNAVELDMIGTTLAGHPFAQTVRPGQCVRVMTGSPVPNGCDTVVMQENVEFKGNKILVKRLPGRGENVRLAGEDLARGSIVLHKGTRIHPPSLGILASVGRAEVTVARRPRIAFFSTGDELRSVGQPLEAGQIYDSNRYTLYGMLHRLGVEVIDLGVVPDTREAIEKAFTDASRMADAVITSGGVSVGDADFVKETLQKLGQVGFWQISMKPGRPLAFGRVNNALFFGLPGNPVSVMVTFYQFVAPAIRRLSGENDVGSAPFIEVPCLSSLHKRPGRTEFQRAILNTDTEGNLVVQSTGSQGSGILRSMSEANCFIVLDSDSGNVEAGTRVKVQPFFGMM